MASCLIDLTCAREFCGRSSAPDNIAYSFPIRARSPFATDLYYRADVTPPVSLQLANSYWFPHLPYVCLAANTLSRLHKIVQLTRPDVVYRVDLLLQVTRDVSCC